VRAPTVLVIGSLLGCAAGEAPISKAAELEQRLAALEQQIAAPVPSDRVESFEAAVCDQAFPWAAPPPAPVGLPSAEIACAALYDRLAREHPDGLDDLAPLKADCVENDARVRRGEGTLTADLLLECAVVHETKDDVVACMKDARDRARPERRWVWCMFKLSLERFHKPPDKLDEIYACYATIHSAADFERCEARAQRISNRVDDREEAEARVHVAQRTADRILDGIEANGCPPASDGHAGPTPELSLDCSSFSGGRCTPTDKQAFDQWYARSEWTDDPGWKHVGFELEYGESYHLELEWTRPEPAACEVTVRIYSDLDADGVYATFTRTGRYADGELARGDWQGEEVME
jgi:hypothetical protein